MIEQGIGNRWFVVCNKCRTHLLLEFDLHYHLAKLANKFGWLWKNGGTYCLNCQKEGLCLEKKKEASSLSVTSASTVKSLKQKTSTKPKENSPAKGGVRNSPKKKGGSTSARSAKKKARR